MEIECSTFKLRPLRVSDKQSLAKSANNRKIWLNVTNLLPHPYTEENAEEFINFVVQQKKLSTFTIDIAGNAVGMISCDQQSGVFCVNAELGYWLAEDFWGKGIVSEAVAKICEYVFSNFELTRISAHVFAYNKGSMRVLEKNGFEREGILRNAILKDNKVADLHVFGRLK